MSIATNTPLPALLFAAIATLAVTGCAVSLDLDGDTTVRFEHETVPTGDLTLVDVDTENGSVEIVDGAGDAITIRVALRESDEGDADYSVVTEGDRLHVRGECDHRWRDTCQVGFELVMPADIDVDVRTSNGRVAVDGLAGAVDVETDNGAIDGERLESRAVAARTDNGRIGLSFAVAPESVDAVTDNGSISLRLPDDRARYDVAAESDNGSVDVDVRTDSSAERLIVAESDNGAIDIRYAAS
jgi:hypothetical protein